MSTGNESNPNPDAATDLLWGTPERSGRGPKPTLTLEQIARAAIAIADAEGLDALSMRRVAETLGFTTMALYRHIHSKTELIAVMVDTAIGDALTLDSLTTTSPTRTLTPNPSPSALGEGSVAMRRVADPTLIPTSAHPLPSRERAGVRANSREAALESTNNPTWRPRLTAWAQQTWLLFQRHPWLLQADMPGSMIGPNRIAWIEAGLQALDETGLSASDRMEVVRLVNSYVLGTAQLSLEWGKDESQAWTTASPLMQRVMSDDRFPIFHSLLDDGALDVTDEAQTAASDAATFAFGLERALDGVAAYILHAARP
jgi:AcrR family transcriptional regulator